MGYDRSVSDSSLIYTNQESVYQKKLEWFLKNFKLRVSSLDSEIYGLEIKTLTFILYLYKIHTYVMIF
jgi:hypothetical protein